MEKKKKKKVKKKGADNIERKDEMVSFVVQINAKVDFYA